MLNKPVGQGRTIESSCQNCLIREVCTSKTRSGIVKLEHANELEITDRVGKVARFTVGLCPNIGGVVVNNIRSLSEDKVHELRLSGVSTLPVHLESEPEAPVVPLIVTDGIKFFIECLDSLVDNSAT